MNFERKTFLAGLAATGAACCSGGSALAQTPAARRIDVHRHLNPPFYADAAKSVAPILSAALRRWSPEAYLADMDAAGIATGMLSMPSDPGISFGDIPAARRLARRSNDYMAELRRTYPGRYGIFATLPMPDVEGSLREIAYAYDQLKADGVAVFTSYDKRFLGDASFEPVWAELHRRKAVVFTHPIINVCCSNIVPDVGQAVIEYGTDTTRTIANLLFSGTASRYPDARVIFSHAGGTMPFLIERFVNEAKNPKIAASLPHGITYELKKFFYDTAQSSNPEAMGALLDMVPSSQVLFGTDYPYRVSTDNVTGLAALQYAPPVAAAIARGNAIGLLHGSGGGSTISP